MTRDATNFEEALDLASNPHDLDLGLSLIVGFVFGFTAWICFWTKSAQIVCNLMTVTISQTIYFIFVQEQIRIYIPKLCTQISKFFSECVASLERVEVC
jgi:hypothetical protein